VVDELSGVSEPKKRLRRGKRDPVTGMTPLEMERWDAQVIGDAIFRNDIEYDLNWVTAYPEGGYTSPVWLTSVIRRLTIAEVLELVSKVKDTLQEDAWDYRFDEQEGRTPGQLAKMIGESTSNVAPVLTMLNRLGYVIATPVTGSYMKYRYKYKKQECFDLGLNSSLKARYVSHCEKEYIQKQQEFQ
jgi:hypothetical protein